MNFYRVVAPHFVAGLAVSNDRVFQSAPLIAWTVGQDFTVVRDYCHRRGWKIDPLADDYHPQFLEIDGDVYELCWHGDTLARISQHKDGDLVDLTYEQLPEQLKQIL